MTMEQLEAMTGGEQLKAEVRIAIFVYWIFKFKMCTVFPFYRISLTHSELCFEIIKGKIQKSFISFNLKSILCNMAWDSNHLFG
jgi:hypothetical protein